MARAQTPAPSSATTTTRRATGSHRASRRRAVGGVGDGGHRRDERRQQSVMLSQRQVSGSSEGRRARVVPAISTVASDRADDRGQPGDARAVAPRQADDAQGGDGDQEGHECVRRQRRRVRPGRSRSHAATTTAATAARPATTRGARPIHGSGRRSAVQPSSSARTASSTRDSNPYRSKRRRRWLSTVRSDSPRAGRDLGVRGTADDQIDDFELAVRGTAPRGPRQLEGRRRVDGAASRDGADGRDDRVEFGRLVQEAGRPAFDRGAHERRLLETRQQDDGRGPE